MLQASGNPSVVDRGSSFRPCCWMGGNKYSPTSVFAVPMFFYHILIGRSVGTTSATRSPYPISWCTRSATSSTSYRRASSRAKCTTRRECTFLFRIRSGDGDNGSGKFVLIAVRREKDGVFLPDGDMEEVSVAPKLCLYFCSRKPRRKFLECVPCIPPHKA